MLVCQTFTMSDLVMLLHGQHQPLTRIQPQLSQFFTQNYLNGREPTDENIAVSTTHLSVARIKRLLCFCGLVPKCYIFSLFFFPLFSLPDVLQAAAASLVNELEEYITESFVSFCFHSLPSCTMSQQFRICSSRHL